MKSVQVSASSSHRHNNPLLKSSGFTLVELMAAVVIIAILVAASVYEAVKADAAHNANDALCALSTAP